MLVVNPSKPELAQVILEKAGIVIQEHLEVGAWREVKLVLRFLGCLQGLLEGDGVFPILEELFSRAVDLQTASSEDVSLINAADMADTDPVHLELGPGARKDHPAYHSIYHGVVSERL